MIHNKLDHQIEIIADKLQFGKKLFPSNPLPFEDYENILEYLLELRRLRMMIDKEIWRRSGNVDEDPFIPLGSRPPIKL